jgi:hypothetical protein
MALSRYAREKGLTATINSYTFEKLQAPEKGRAPKDNFPDQDLQ